VTARAWALVAGAYVLLAVGAVVTLFLIDQKADAIEANAERLRAASGAFCEVVLTNDDVRERLVLERLARGEPITIHPTCRDIVARLED
jgi:hypothetical protein